MMIVILNDVNNSIFIIIRYSALFTYNNKGFMVNSMVHLFITFSVYYFCWGLCDLTELDHIM